MLELANLGLSEDVVLVPGRKLGTCCRSTPWWCSIRSGRLLHPAAALVALVHLLVEGSASSRIPAPESGAPQAASAKPGSSPSFSPSSAICKSS